MENYNLLSADIAYEEPHLTIGILKSHVRGPTDDSLSTSGTLQCSRTNIYAPT